MKRDIEAYKEYLRAMVGEIYWEQPPAMYLFQREYMSRDGALLFALEHCQFTDLFPRWFGNIIANCPFIDVRAYMIENMFVEEVKDPTIDVGHNESMWAFAKALGATEMEIREYVPLTVTTMALHYFDNVSRTKPWLEAFAAIACLEMLTNAALAARYGQIPGNSSKPWSKLGLKKDAMSHWEAAEHADHGVGDDGPGHGESALDMLARHAHTEADQLRAAAAMRESILVHKYQYDQIGLKAIELTKKSTSVNA
jgi:pyrroloquinoline quinone (PQQ) biosynthesis protein C